MPTPPFQPQLSDVIRHGIEEDRMDLHTACPATVVRVDLAKGQIDAKPLVRDIVQPTPDVRLAVSVPIITNVPIVWPGANGMRITFPMQVGDFVLLIFAERSIDTWLSSGNEVDPGDPRRHAMSDAIAIPGIRPFNKAWHGADAAKITIGSEDGASHTAAWADEVATALANLKSAVESHTHKYNPGPGSLVPTLSPLASSSPDVPVSIPDVQSKTTLIKG